MDAGQCGVCLRISVIIPTRHRNELLAQCLDRLAPGAQTLDASEYEVIVTDDGSDSTAEAMLKDRYPWVRWVAGPRRGPAANRNNGARCARADWLAFTDDDCLPQTAWLASYVAAIDSGGAAAMVLEGKTTCLAGIHSPLMHSPTNLNGGWLWSCNMAVRRSFFESVGRFDERYPRPHMEDVDFRDRVFEAGVRPVWCPEAAVDHPPRRIALFAGAVGDHECEVIYELKHARTPRLVSMLYTTLVARARTMRRHRISRDWFLFGASAAIEAIYFVVRFSGWVRRNRHPAAPAASAA